MAKTNEAGFLEQHVEKAVLGVTVLVMAFAAYWVISGPRSVPLGTSQYPPDKVDEELLRQARRLEGMLERKQLKLPDVPPYLERLKELIYTPYEEDEVGDYVAWQRGRKPLDLGPEEGGDVPTVELASLIKDVLPAEQPIAQIHREVVAPAPEDRSAAEADAKPTEPVEVIAAHVAAVFDHGGLLTRWRKLLEKTPVRASFTVVTVEAERCFRLPDGSWSEPVPVSMARLPGPALAVMLPDYDGNNLDVVRRGIADLASVQQDVLEPEYPDIVWPDLRVGTWMRHKPRTRVSDLLDQAAAPQPGAGAVRRIYRTRSDVRPGVNLPPLQRSGEDDPRRILDYRRRAEEQRRMDQQAPEDYMKQLRELREGSSRTPTMTAPPRPRTTAQPSRTRSTRQPSRTRTTRQPSRTRVTGPTGTGRRDLAGRRDAIRPERGPAGLPAGTARRLGQEQEPEEVEIPFVPSLAVQLSHEKGILEVWFHDNKDLTEGMTYSYRLRLVLVNPLFGQFRGVGKEDDKKTLKVFTPWSQWSEPVTVKRSTEFFLAGQFPIREEVYVDVFALKWGQRVRRRFNIRRGEPIGEVVEMKLVGFDGKLQTTKVDFNTGAIAVDFDFGREVRHPKTDMAGKTTEMLYLSPDDPHGELKTRTVVEDQASERLQELRKQVDQAPTVAAGQPAPRL